MNGKPAVRFENVSKTFPRHGGARLIAQMLRPRQPHPPFYALRDVSFEVASGAGVAVVGGNGAGKSTLLGLTAGLARPNAGRVEVNGTIAALLDLGCGFHPDLTGRENVFLNASLMGFSEKQTRLLFDGIVAFSGIGDFIDEPLRTYSSGMIVRLAFSVAVNLDPDILIIDEVLAVGDSEFQAKCFARILELRRAGKTFLCVSHSRHMLEGVCDSALWLDHGRVVMKGALGEVFDAYASGAAVRK